MAKVSGPLFSLTASGSIAKKALVFSNDGQSTVAKTWKIDKRETTPAQKAYYEDLKKAHRLWKELPQYLKDAWLTTSLEQPGVSQGDPSRPSIKGKLLFLHYAINFIHRGGRAQAAPYWPDPAPEKLSYDLVKFEIT